mmetsp:Transcript_3980/g.13955  ORF Transcript_3980/g.13955 Transcript_3980/m.13955 type:complete len:337 (+) Transcript_3980:3-1013(+)
MFGSSAGRFLLDAHLKGIPFNASAAYSGMRAQATTERGARLTREGFDSYAKFGYVPLETALTGTSFTLAYALDDWVAGRMAQAVGAPAAEAEFFLNRSQSYRNVFDPSTGFFCPREETGAFHCPEVPVLDPAGYYKEGNAWHYRFNVPHDVSGLIELFRSANLDFVEELRKFTERAREYAGTALPNLWFWVGNEHDLLAPHLFAYASRLDLTTSHVRWTLKHRFSAKPNGVPGNDDYGATSAWYVWGALGLYPEIGSGRYILGAPLFERAVLSVGDDGETLTILAHGWCPECVYVVAAAVDGAPVKLPQAPFVEHRNLVRGNVTLEFWLAETPTMY